MVEPARSPRDARAPILLVDDRPANLVALEAVLASPEYELVRAASGREALVEVERRAFAVVLLDVQMPIMDGVETAQHMNEIGVRYGWQVPIIFVTGIDSERSRILRAYASGAVDFIQKPLEPEVIRSKVSVFVALYRANQRLVAEIDVRRRLQEALRAREDLLAVVAHDVRSPLSAVLIAANRIEQFAEDPARTKKAADSIVRAVERLSRLVDDLLDLAKLEEGQLLSINRNDHDIVQLILSVSDLLEPLASSGELTLAAEVSDPIHAMCDCDRVEQVLANLIGNAIKFTPAGGTIRLAARRTADEIIVSVSDTGTGIPEEQVPHLFERYWQAVPQRRQGVGLGLSIVKAIVDSHGGRVWVQTVAGTGSTFYFTLPVTGDAPGTAHAGA